MKNDNQFVGGETFHSQERKVYTGSAFRGEGGFAVNKRHSEMAKVLYEPAHENRQFQDERRGRGKDYATWVFSEEKGLKENLFSTDFELMIDARLEPDASIGLHTHHSTEEIYYILEGSIRITTVASNGKDEWSEELSAGDAHLVRIGQSHYGTAGNAGVRFLAVAIHK
jgi:quercetin dioxygenase-like cupin family protein